MILINKNLRKKNFPRNEPYFQVGVPKVIGEKMCSLTVDSSCSWIVFPPGFFTSFYGFSFMLSIILLMNETEHGVYNFIRWPLITFSWPNYGSEYGFEREDTLLFQTMKKREKRSFPSVKGYEIDNRIRIGLCTGWLLHLFVLDKETNCSLRAERMNLREVFRKRWNLLLSSV